MNIARNWLVDAPPERSLLDCEMLSEELKPFEGWAARGTQISTSNLPKGLVLLTELGLVFLADGTRGNIDKKGMFSYVAMRSAANAIPFGGLVVAGALAGMSALKNKEAEMEKRQNHPDSQWAPFVEIVSVEYEETKGFLSKTGYLRVRRQLANDQTVDFFFTPGTEEIADLIFIQRFSIEKEFLTNKYLDEVAGYSSFVDSKKVEMVEKYGTQWEVLHMEEFRVACSQHLDDKLKERGLTYEKLDDQIRDDLQHFRGVAQIADYFKT